MTLNCPQYIDMPCEECRKYYDEQCWWFFPSKPITEILTDTERIEHLENKPKGMPMNNQQLYKSFDQLKAEFIFIRNKFNKLYDKKRPNKNVTKYLNE